MFDFLKAKTNNKPEILVRQLGTGDKVGITDFTLVVLPGGTAIIADDGQYGLYRIVFTYPDGVDLSVACWPSVETSLESEIADEKKICASVGYQFLSQDTIEPIRLLFWT